MKQFPTLDGLSQKLKGLWKVWALISFLAFAACTDQKTWYTIHEFPEDKSIVIQEANGDIDIEPRSGRNPDYNDATNIVDKRSKHNYYSLQTNNFDGYTLSYEDKEWFLLRSDTKFGRAFQGKFAKKWDTIYIWDNKLYPADLTPEQIMKDDIHAWTERDTVSTH